MSDYISREALIGKVEKHYCAPCKGQGGDLGGDWCRSCVINSVLEKVRGIPAADVIPVVHGRWIGIDSSFWKPTHSSDIPVFRKTYRCSECGRRTAIAENYCPNCGAKMDKEATNELD